MGAQERELPQHRGGQWHGSPFQTDPGAEGEEKLAKTRAGGWSGRGWGSQKAVMPAGDRGGHGNRGKVTHEMVSIVYWAASCPEHVRKNSFMKCQRQQRGCVDLGVGRGK